jgi:hypothetical protein
MGALKKTREATMRAFLLATAAAALSACATSQPEAQTSWGKANVAFLDYWSDAAQCTLAGAQAEVSLPVGTLNIKRDASPIADPAIQDRVSSDDASTVGVNDMIMRARLNRVQQMRAMDRARQAVVDQCLAERGYRRFQLTAEQSARLQTLPEGTRERREFLHGLASDPAILSAQGV